jgi:SOS-response transcriptional repressor LexA
VKSRPVAQRLISFGQSRFGDGHGWQRKFAAALGIAPQTVNAYLTGVRQPGNDMQARLRAMGCDIGWLMYGEEKGNEGKEKPEPFAVGAIPLIGKIVASPNGKEYFEDSPEGLTIPWAKGNYFALVVEGDSLINAPEGHGSTELYPGDICVFLLGLQPKTGDIVCVQMKQSTIRMVKILKHKSAEEVELASANKFRNYPSVIVKKDQIAAFGVFAGKVKLTKRESNGRGLG